MNITYNIYNMNVYIYIYLHTTSINMNIYIYTHIINMLCEDIGVEHVL